MFEIKNTVLATLACLSLTVTAVQAAETVRIEECGKAADGFTFMVDVSGSMQRTVGEMKDEAGKAYDQLIEEGKFQARVRPVPPANDALDKLRRVSLAKAFVKDAAGYALEKTDMTSGLYSLAPFTVMAAGGQRDKETMLKLVDEKLVEDLEAFGRPTWLGQRGFDFLSTPVSGTQSLFIVTDGDFDVQTEGKHKPAEAIQAFLKANPRSCVHVVSAAYTPEEKAAVEALARLPGCVKTEDLEGLMSNDELRHQFYEEAFYKDCAKVPVIELHDVYFDFDKSTLRPEGKVALDKALTVIKANHGEDRVTVVGWTDSMGTDAYNLRLSLRRAEAVKAYLAEKGIALDKLASEGRGESFKYNNGTEEGRQQNRRVELHFEQ